MITDSKSNAAQMGRFIGSPTSIDSSSVAATVGPMKPRTAYGIYFTATGTFRWGLTGGIAATDSDHFSTAGSRTYHVTDDTNLFFSCKLPTGTGKVQLAEIALD